MTEKVITDAHKIPPIHKCVTGTCDDPECHHAHVMLYDYRDKAIAQLVVDWEFWKGLTAQVQDVLYRRSAELK